MDKFSELPTTLIAPARDAEAVTPSDTANLVSLPRALFVGQAGNLSVLMAGGQTVQFTGIQAGSFLPIRAQRINAAGTTAGGILALW
jgi:hypothetical protein